MFHSKQKPLKPKTMERNVIAKNTSITGEIISEGDFRVDGSLEGTLKTKGRVIIGVDGLVKGIESANADIEGRFSGELVVHETLSIKGTSNITGDILIGKLSVEPGAIFNATCAMKGAVKELNQHEQQQRLLSEKTA